LYKELLRQELKLNGIKIIEECEPDFPNIFEVLEKILYIKAHEGKFPQMGVIFSGEDITKYADEILYIKNEDIDSSLRLSDGETSFLWFGYDGVLNGIALVDEIKNKEYNVLETSKATNSLIFIYKNKQLKIFAEEKIYIHENRTWVVKDPIGKKVDKILDLTNYEYPEIISNLVKFAYYELSPKKIGSTLVYLLDSEEEVDKKLTPPIDFSGYNIDFENTKHHNLIKNFLKQIDGATVIHSNGNIWGTGLHLQYSKKSKGIVIEEGGTRHTSAKRFSFDKGRCIVIVTSEDGPVTIYSDGVSIPISISNKSFEKMYQKKKNHELEPGAMIKSDIAVCPQCGKKYRIETVKSSVLYRTKYVYCEVCETEIYNARVKDIDYKIIK